MFVQDLPKNKTTCGVVVSVTLEMQAVTLSVSFSPTSCVMLGESPTSLGLFSPLQKKKVVLDPWLNNIF